MENYKTPRNSGVVLNVSQMIKMVMTSAAESEIGAMNVNACKAIPKIIAIIKMGHSEPRTLMQTNNLSVKSVLISHTGTERMVKYILY